MITFPNGKINLGLFVTGKRPDGYHNIISCFHPIAWCDVLEVVESKEFQFSASGIDIPGDSADNLCKKAYDLLATGFQLPQVQIHLHKVIPIDAGLGGGSSDGASTLKMLNELFELGLTNENLTNYAGQLGSDCPFFIENKPVIATGVGTDFEDIAVNLSGYHIALIDPGIHISTTEAYASVIYTKPSLNLKEALCTKQVSEWRNFLNNDFESSIFRNHPEIEKLKDELYDQGAVYASMTGSGSTVYGIFDSKPDLSSVSELGKGFVVHL